MTEGRPSATALLIARSLVFLSREPEIGALIPPEAVEVSRWLGEAAAPRMDRLLRGLARRRWFRRLVWGVERTSIPGMMLHYALRKRRLEELAREALAEGYGQVVRFGAGYDSLAHRLAPEFPDRLFLEIDHPATQAVKRKALSARGEPRRNLVLLPVDLAREGLEKAMSSAPGFSAQAETLYIAEGLLMYLQQPALDRLFAFCRKHGGIRPRLAFTFMERLEGGRIGFRRQSRAVDRWLTGRGEPFRWGVPASELPGFLARRGWRPREIATADALRERYLTTPGLRKLALADGDHVCMAEAGPG